MRFYDDINVKQKEMNSNLQSELLTIRRVTLSSFGQCNKSLDEIEKCGCKFNLDSVLNFLELADNIRSVVNIAEHTDIASITIYDYLFLDYCRSALFWLQQKLSLNKPADSVGCIHLLIKYNSLIKELTLLDVDEAIKFLSCPDPSLRFLPKTASDSNELGELMTSSHEANKKAYSTIYKVVFYARYLLKKARPRKSISQIKKYTLLVNGAREYSKKNHKSECDMIRKQTRKISDYPKSDITVEHWWNMRKTEDNALRYASEGNLSSSTDTCFEYYKELNIIEKMEQNKVMMSMIPDYFPDDSLFEFEGMANERWGLIDVLDFHNIDLFYRLVLRGNIIRCNLYPKLKPEFEKWMGNENYVETKGNNNSGDKSAKINDEKQSDLSDADNKLLKEIKDILAKGEWKKPATCKKVEKWVETLFGFSDFRNFFKVGRGSKNYNRLQISTANIVGYLMECGYLTNSPKQLSKIFFDIYGQENNINKGKSGCCSQTLKNLIKLMDEHRNKIIEKSR